MSSIEFLSDDKRSTSITSDLFPLKTLIIHKNCMWKTGFEDYQCEIDFELNANLSDAYDYLHQKPL